MKKALFCISRTHKRKSYYQQRATDLGVPITFNKQFNHGTINISPGCASPCPNDDEEESGAYRDPRV